MPATLLLGNGNGSSLNGGGGSSSLIWTFNSSAAEDIVNCCTVAPTVTRAGTSLTRVNSSGLIETVAANTWLRDYDPTTLNLVGHIPWEARTNLLLRSEEFDNASWTKTNSTIDANATTSPTGAAIADRINATGAAGGPLQSITVTATSVYQTYVFVKADSVSWMRFRLVAGATNRSAWANLTTGAAGTVNAPTGELSTFSMGSGVSYPNGWWRFQVTFATATVTSVEIRLIPASADNTDSASGNSIFAWGAQAELGADISAYIPTTTATVTRPATVCTLATASIPGFSASTLTMVGRGFRYSAATSNTKIMVLDDGTSSNRHQIGVGAANASSGLTVDTGATQASITSATWNTGVVKGIAYRAAANNFALSFDGGAEVTDVAGTMATGVTTLRIGSATGPSSWNAGIQSLALYNTANTSLQNYSA